MLLSNNNLGPIAGAVKDYTDKWVELYGGKVVKRTAPLYQGKQIRSKEAFVRMAAVSDFGPPGPVGELEGFPQALRNAIGQPRDYSAVKRGLEVRLSNEALERDVDGLAHDSGKMLALSLHEGIESERAAPINMGFSANAEYNIIAFPEPLFMTNHQTGFGTASNRGLRNSAGVFVDFAFSSWALERALQELLVQRSHAGNAASREGPFILFCHPSILGRVNRVVHSEHWAGTNNNDKNWMTTRIKDILWSPHFTFEQAWGLVDVGLRGNGFHEIVFRPPTSNSYVTDSNDGMVYQVSYIGRSLCTDWRGTWGTTGAV